MGATTKNAGIKMQLLITISLVFASSILFQEQDTRILFQGQDTSAAAMASSDTNKGNSNVETKVEDTSVVIISSWIPMHPSLYFINYTMHSIHQKLKGLSPTAPIFIAIDGVNPRNMNTTQKNQLHEYANNLRSAYGHLDHIQILEAQKWLHITGNIKQAIERIETKYIYIVEHDFPFRKEINHTALVKTFEEHHPHGIKMVRFNKRVNSHRQGKEHGFDMNTTLPKRLNGIRLIKTCKWSK